MKNRPQATTYTVAFYSNCKEKVDTQSIAFGSKIVQPIDPNREGYTFLGWYLHGKPFDFSIAPTQSCTLIAHWKNNCDTFAAPSMEITTFEGINAGLHVVWKDYANARDLRPDAVSCILTQSCGNDKQVYEIILKKNSVAWKDPFQKPSNATLVQGDGGEWTLSLKGLPEKIDFLPCKYTLTQRPLDGEYTTLQSGTEVINTIRNYLPSIDTSARLTTRNARLYDAAGNMIVLRGVVTLNVSTEYGLKESTTVEALQRLAKIGCNGLRLTAQLIGDPEIFSGYVYYANGFSRTGSYNDGNAVRVSEADKQKVIEIVNSVIENATKVGLYTVIDWGILSSNPYQYVNEACEFFGILAKKHADNPYVLFEICNEPHSNTPWSGSNGIKAYAERVIDVIRQNGSDAIVIVGPRGSSTFLSTQEGDDPIHSPLDDDRAYNVAYTFHCYPYNYKYYHSETQWHYSWRLREAHNAGLTVITTEMSPMNATFDNRDNLAYDMAQTALYIRMFQEWDISFFYFRYASPTSPYTEWMMFNPKVDLTLHNWTRADLTVCGKWYYDWMTGDGIFASDIDYTAPKKRATVALFDDTHKSYGLGNVFPGFALKGTKIEHGYFFEINDCDSLTDIQYVTYCERIHQCIKVTMDETKKQPEKPLPSIPSQKTEPMELVYLYDGKNLTLQLSYGQNKSGAWGVFLNIF